MRINHWFTVKPTTAFNQSRIVIKKAQFPNKWIDTGTFAREISSPKNPETGFIFFGTVGAKHTLREGFAYGQLILGFHQTTLYPNASP
jgi:hypothetical protein